MRARIALPCSTEAIEIRYIEAYIGLTSLNPLWNRCISEVGGGGGGGEEGIEGIEVLNV